MSKPFNSRNKGATYERKVAKMMSDWWGGQFSRVPASGGLNWGADQRVAGDIVPPPESGFPFVIECKKREDWTFDHILLNIGTPKDWWQQVVMDSRRVNQVPLLIFSRNRAKDFIMIPHEDEMYKSLQDIDYDVSRTAVTIENIRGEIQEFEVILTTFDTFIALGTETIKEYAKEVKWDKYAEDYK